MTKRQRKELPFKTAPPVWALAAPSVYKGCGNGAKVQKNIESATLSV